MKKKPTTVNAEDAGRILGISPETIRLWCKRGRIKARETKDDRGRNVFIIPTDQLTSRLFKCECVICGKLFKSKRPAKSRFCSYAHRMKWHALNRKQYAMPGRPKPGTKPLPKGAALKNFLKKRGRG